MLLCVPGGSGRHFKIGPVADGRQHSLRQSALTAE